MPVSPELLDLLVCPESRQKLVYVPPGVDGPDEALFCPTSRLKYRIDDGIPVMLVEEAERLDEARAARLGELAGRGA
ncbi:MAG TPA: Trm112 family protein [Kofleriaceae bacterium]|nr:Trm112 family protein [Kofleriaceae bacterium]